MITDGLYLSIDDDGNIERYLLLDNERIELEPTTIKNEIIEFSDSNFTPYEELMDALGEIANQVTFQQLEFEELYTLAYDICEELTKSNIIWGVLSKTLLDDNVLYVVNPEQIEVDTATEIFHCFNDVLILHRRIHQYLYNRSDNISIDFEKDFPDFMNVTAPQIFGIYKTEYHFRSLIQYMVFIMIHFIRNNYIVSWCECCGKYFVPKTKSRTIYCDRILYDNKTCKQIGPKLKQKKMAEDDPVIREYERVKNTLRKRVERTENFGGGDKCMSYNEYYNWLKVASLARTQYLNGKISAEDALKIFNDFEQPLFFDSAYQILIRDIDI